MKPFLLLNGLGWGWPTAVLAAEKGPATKSPVPNAAPPPAGAAPMTDIHDIKPLIAMGPDLRWLYWALAVVALAVLLALVWWIWRRRKAGPAMEAKIAPPAPEVEAYQLLDALAAADIGDPKLFYFQLSAILRHYMERRFGIPAAEMTTEELLPRTRRLALESDLAHALQSFCQSSDPIKFADRTVHAEQLPRDLAFVRSFVRRTTNSASPEQTEAPGDAKAPESEIEGEPIPRLALNRQPEND